MTDQRYKEQKLPKYTELLGWKSFQMKYLSAAGTRGNTRQALKGKYINKMPAWTYQDDERPRELTEEQSTME